MPCTRKNTFYHRQPCDTGNYFFFYQCLKAEAQRICETYSRVKHNFFFSFLFTTVSSVPETEPGKEQVFSRSLLDITDESYGQGFLFQALIFLLLHHREAVLATLICQQCSVFFKLLSGIFILAGTGVFKHAELMIMPLVSPLQLS